MQNIFEHILYLKIFEGYDPDHKIFKIADIKFNNLGFCNIIISYNNHNTTIAAGFEYDNIIKKCFNVIGTIIMTKSDKNSEFYNKKWNAIEPVLNIICHRYLHDNIDEYEKIKLFLS